MQSDLEMLREGCLVRLQGISSLSQPVRVVYIGVHPRSGEVGIEYAVTGLPDFYWAHLKDIISVETL